MAANRTLILKNCRLYNHLNEALVHIVIENGRIRSIGSEPEDNSSECIDVAGKIVAPGFIDVHIQGAGGCDVLDALVDSLKTMSKTLARFGVTGFLATTVMDPVQENNHLKILANHWKDDLGGARILGLHLEGPFINPEKRGGIARSAIYPPTKERLGKILDLTGNSLKMMTIAPELEGSGYIIDQLIQFGCIPSFGHSAANYQQAKEAFNNGIEHVTHIFNAMPPLHHREPGPLLAILESETVSVQIISDGVHLHPGIVRYLNHVIGIDRCVCITDGIQAIGLPEGKYRYNNRDYFSKNGAARYEDGTLIGTALALNEIGARFQKFTNCNLEEAVDSISLNPARLLGLDDRKGYIQAGKDADLVVMNSDFNVDLTIVSGEAVY
ncbi:MAG: N-acetylglucosamine-6-phosphate deacetylase [Candidatus Marinimicrobia bacterium]|nr:N-acetylglucosamine-6-phosphate deacetylase [Candidatus Neomarinimicrobiota bacterium]